MIWLLPYLGWTLAASAVASAAGYAAVTQFSVIQRVLAMALDRALRKLAGSEDGRSTYTVEHTGTGKALVHSHHTIDHLCFFPRLRAKALSNTPKYSQIFCATLIARHYHPKLQV